MMSKHTTEIHNTFCCDDQLWATRRTRFCNSNPLG